MVVTGARPVATPTIESWTHTPWRKLEVYVYRLQKAIHKAQRRGNRRTVHSLQRLLLKSRAARTLAVRRVTQDNQGKKTAGIDGIKAVGPMVRLLFVDQLRDFRTIRARPVRRVWIPKPGKIEKRPLGIPVLFDRAHQALVKLALEPQWEARFEPNSYGFRPGRSCHDAIEAIFTDIGKKSKYVLDADLKGCFDTINHTALLAKVDAPPLMRRAVKAWLRAGVMDGLDFSPTIQGTPQGGVISPLLANIALHGLEVATEQAHQYQGSSGNRYRPKLIRFADDFIVLCHTEEGVLAAKAAIEQWLAGMGLQFNPAKTSITHTLHRIEGRCGFDFLGFTIRQYPVGKTHTGTNAQGTALGFKTLITPSKGAVTRHNAHLNEVVRKHRSAPQAALIASLNPIIRGWSNYYRTVVSAMTFQACDATVYAQLQHWARRRHPKKGHGWVARRYWSMQPGARWEFVVKEHGEIVHRLRKHADTTVRRHIKVKGTASPFDGNFLYWARRLRTHPLVQGTEALLLHQQHGRCACCNLLFREGELREVDHIIPTAQGGPDRIGNKQLLHRHCHDQKTARDLAHGCSCQEPGRRGAV
jgi:RNA-directed DNA polymerase